MQTDLLLIDDSPTDLRVLMQMLEAHRLRFSVAFDGNKGYHQAQMLRPSLILLDVCMPKLDGLATCRLLKANPATQTIPVIFLTAANNLRERLDGFAAGAVDYIGKPFHEEEVLARVGVHLRAAPRMDDDVAAESAVAEGSCRRDAVLVRAAQTILRETIAHPPSLVNLARQLGTNRRQIGEAFQHCLGQPVFAWLREERLRLAHQLVCRSETPMSQIAEHLGYSSSSNMARAFGERFGFNPSDLRREMRLARLDQDAGA